MRFFKQCVYSFVLVIVLIVSGLIAARPIWAQTVNVPIPNQYTVVHVQKDDVLNVRRFGNPTAPIVGSLPPNARNVTVLEKSGNWWLITSSGVRGWVSSQFLQEEPTQSFQEGKQFDGYAYQYNNESSTTVASLEACNQSCGESLDCKAFTYFKSRKLCRLMTRTDVALVRNSDAISGIARGGDQSTALVQLSSGHLPAANQGRRAALLIGNSNYQHSAKLKNPANDAATLADSLRNAGFESITVKTDLTREQTIRALRDFVRDADSADWATVYYSGHGMEFGGVNYLIPVDAALETDRDIDLEAVDVGKVINAVEGAKRLRLVILDACRNNPFASQMRRTVATRSIGKGLAPVEPETGTLIIYAAKHGEFALDGAGANSPFVEALTKRIAERPSQEVRRLFDLVRDDVMEATKKKQQPFSYGSLSGREDFYFGR
jgi:hypothetical protein